ncbi:EamA family transporter RarD [Oceanidesulfovibrio marinus]|nr:EamA family transporter RarD [Oceanidesulfovibrio marinus]
MSMQQPTSHTPPAASPSGIIAALGSFLLWGVLPLYWKQLDNIPSFEILCHRIVWSAVFTALVLVLAGRFHEVREALASRRTIALLLISSVLVSANWGLYIWSVNHAHVVEASMGYYINPLVNVLLGMVFFKDKLRRLQWVAVGFAITGVLVMVVDFGRLPWIALGLAFSFGFYGLVRKVVAVLPVPGLFLETLLLSLPAGAYILWQEMHGVGGLVTGGGLQITLLVCAGVVTSIPLLLFTFGARRLPLPTLGIAQYLSPTCMFLLGVFVFHEPFGATKLVTFACIWTGVAVYVTDGLIEHRKITQVRSAE